MRNKIRDRVYGLIYVLITSGIIGYFSYLGVLSTSSSREYPSYNIYIGSNNDLVNYGFPGSGSQNDPFIIENYTIFSSYNAAIYISGISKYVIIRNNFLQSYGDAIKIWSASSTTIKIINNTCVGNIYENSPVSHSGIGVYNINGCDIYNNTCLNFREGIKLSNCINCTIINNQLKDNDRNVVMSSCSNINISNNSLIVDQDLSGVPIVMWYSYHESLYISDCANINIKMNVFENSGLDIDGNNASSFIIQDNIVNGFELGFFVNEKNLDINSSFIFGQLLFINCNDSIIRNQNISSTNYGILLINCLNFSIFSCNCSNNFHEGIHLKNSENITIINCTFSNNNYGTYGSNSNTITLTNNIYNSNVFGTYVSYSNTIILLNNTFANNEYGIYSISSNSTYNQNYFFNNTYDVYSS